MHELPSILMLVCAIACFAFGAAESMKVKILAIGVYLACATAASIMLLGLQLCWIGIVFAVVVFCAFALVCSWALVRGEADAAVNRRKIDELH
jgi:hypothetical protein